MCPYTGVTHTILLTITGRKPLCLRCPYTGVKMSDVPHTSSVVCPYTGVKMGDVPHTSSVVCPYTGVTHTILLTITGRKPLCLRCNGEGHVRRDCNVTYCRHHEVYGHATESCAEAKLEGRRDGWGLLPKRNVVSGEPLHVSYRRRGVVSRPSARGVAPLRHRGHRSPPVQEVLLEMLLFLRRL